MSEPFRLHPSKVVVCLAAIALEIVVMALLGLTTTHHEIIGVTGAVAVLLAVIAAVLAGPWIGCLVAVVAGAAFFGFVSDFGKTAPLTGTLVSAVVWSLSALIAGVVADRLRQQEAARRAAEHEAGRLHSRLEASLLPRLDPDVGDLHLVWRSLPSEERLGIGGDFYDVATSPAGAPALVIGDVVGHGPDAAALGATLRAAWHALVTSGASEDVLVGTLSAILARERPSPDAFATVCLVWFKSDCSRASFLLLGHPPPLLATGGGVEEVAIKPTLPLGLAAAKGRRSTSLRLPPVWSLLLYTDGLVEGHASPGAPERYGVARLLDSLRAASGDGIGQDELDRVLADIVTANGGPLPDDVAMLCVTRTR